MLWNSNDDLFCVKKNLVKSAIFSFVLMQCQVRDFNGRHWGQQMSDLQQEGVPVDDLEDPVRARDEP